MNKARASGVYTLLEGLDVQAKFATIMRRLDDLEAKGVQEVQILNEGITQPCLICKSMEHGVQSCPTLPAMQDMFSKQANALGTYKQYFNNSPYSTLIIQVGGIIQIYHGEEVTMTSFSSQETDFKVIRLISGKVFNHKKHKVGDKTLEILEVLKQVKINIPLLDMIKQVFAYAKFLKDLWNMKRIIKLSKKAFLTEQVSAIIENKAMVKYKNPGCPTISV
ncbi:hypothetical protein CK203_054208 [Vitis vinifera]|uniref:Uncharacterized protein n=1 Tax=Vitis vinifera TaxID=29760 RepID=A0A438HGB4_VITVI|nr:hypothetical protein CK203_054208 [Vitis vinifera]